LCNNTESRVVTSGYFENIGRPFIFLFYAYYYIKYVLWLGRLGVKIPFSDKFHCQEEYYLKKFCAKKKFRSSHFFGKLLEKNEVLKKKNWQIFKYRIE